MAEIKKLLKKVKQNHILCTCTIKGFLFLPETLVNHAMRGMDREIFILKGELV